MKRMFAVPVLMLLVLVLGFGAVAEGSVMTISDVIDFTEGGGWKAIHDGEYYYAYNDDCACYVQAVDDSEFDGLPATLIVGVQAALVSEVLEKELSWSDYEEYNGFTYCYAIDSEELLVSAVRDGVCVLLYTTPEVGIETLQSLMLQLAPCGAEPVYQDITLTCVLCGEDFPFTVSEQEFYAKQGYTSQPKRCQACRAARRAEHGSGEATERKLYQVICDSCGSLTEVPYERNPNFPVYCKDCFNAMRPER